METKLDETSARRALAQVEDPRFQRAVPRHFKFISDREVTPQSFLWLLCWAITGQRSERAERQAQAAFNAIFPWPYDFVVARVPHEFARENRYRGGSLVEDRLQDMLGPAPCGAAAPPPTPAPDRQTYRTPAPIEPPPSLRVRIAEVVYTLIAGVPIRRQ